MQHEITIHPLAAILWGGALIMGALTVALAAGIVIVAVRR